jgi:hypothetical protein
MIDTILFPGKTSVILLFRLLIVSFFDNFASDQPKIAFACLKTWCCNCAYASDFEKNSNYFRT